MDHITYCKRILYRFILINKKYSDFKYYYCIDKTGFS